jgi:hypothetical protein
VLHIRTCKACVIIRNRLKTIKNIVYGTSICGGSEKDVSEESTNKHSLHTYLNNSFLTRNSFVILRNVIVIIVCSTLKPYIKCILLILCNSVFAV